MTKVWLVDDDQIFIDIVMLLNESSEAALDFQVFPSGTAFLAALDEAANNELPHVIMLDVTMPDLTGWEVLAALQERNWDTDYNIPIHLVTSFANLEDRKRAETFPEVSAYVVKPISMDYLMSLSK